MNKMPKPITRARDMHVMGGFRRDSSSYPKILVSHKWMTTASDVADSHWPKIRGHDPRDDAQGSVNEFSQVTMTPIEQYKRIVV